MNSVHGLLCDKVRVNIIQSQRSSLQALNYVSNTKQVSPHMAYTYSECDSRYRSTLWISS